MRSRGSMVLCAARVVMCALAVFMSPEGAGAQGTGAIAPCARRPDGNAIVAASVTIQGIRMTGSIVPLMSHSSWPPPCSLTSPQSASVAHYVHRIKSAVW